MFAGAGLAEEGVERVIATSDGLVAGHLAIGLDSMLEAVQLPACVTDLDTSLANVYGDTFTLELKEGKCSYLMLNKGSYHISHELKLRSRAIDDKFIGALGTGTYSKQPVI